MFGLDGKTVVLTGATRGIGLAMAHAFAEAGATGDLASNEAAACQDLAAVLFLAGPGAGFITGQVLIVDGGTLISDVN